MGPHNMKKKVYINPATQIFHVQMSEGVMLSLSDTTGSNNGYDMETKDGGDWDIWGNGSDSDYEDDY